MQLSFIVYYLPLCIMVSGSDVLVNTYPGLQTIVYNHKDVDTGAYVYLLIMNLTYIKSILRIT